MSLVSLLSVCNKCKNEYDIHEEKGLGNDICYRCTHEENIILTYTETKINKSPILNIRIYNELFKTNEKYFYNIIDKFLPWKHHKNKRESFTFGEEKYQIKFGGYNNKPVKIANKKCISYSKFPVLLYFKKILEELLNTIFRFCVIQRYPNKNIDMYAHCDRILNSKFTVICGLSFGGERILRMSLGKKTLDFNLPSGSLYVLIPPTNNVWKHEIPKMKDEVGIRYSLTFR
jgi:hypothetical protein